MNENEFDKQIDTITSLIQDLFDISAVYRQNQDIVFSLNRRLMDHNRALKLLQERLNTAGYRFRISSQEDITVLSINPKRHLLIPKTNIILFCLTLFSVYFVPVFLRNLTAVLAQISIPADITVSFLDEVRMLVHIAPLAFKNTLLDLSRGAGIEFTLAMISILFVHEMGHFVASRRRNIITSWPYFIPAPNIIGTFGAIIKSKSPFYNRRDLIEVGAAGPIAGWIVAVFWLIFGLSQSNYFPPSAFSFKDLSFSLEGESILMQLSTLTFIGQAPAGFYYKLTEAAFAGWVGLLVTAINLLPIGQLDGGHILYGLVRRRQHILGLIAMGGLFLLGFQSQMWWFFAAFGLIFGVKHPPTIDDSRPLSKPAFYMGIAAIIIMILSFTPVPFR